MAQAAESLRLPLFPSSPEGEIRDTLLRMIPEHSETGSEDPGETGAESQESIKVHDVRPLEKKDLIRILPWFADPEAPRHLEPLPKLPKNPNDENEVMETVLDLGRYYDNQGEPNKIAPLVAVNEKDRPLGVATIRWRGDPWVPEGHKIASIERVVVNPKIRGRDIGKQLMERALKTVFGNGYSEARVWVFIDDKAGPDKGGRNLHFFHNLLGFDILRGENYSWRAYAQKRGLGENVEDREALWLSLKKEDWEAWEKKEKGKSARQQELPPSTNGSAVK